MEKSTSYVLLSMNMMSTLETLSMSSGGSMIFKYCYAKRPNIVHIQKIKQKLH